MSSKIKTRADFRQLAETRLEEAKLLLHAGRWSGAYYLAGYSIELGLKACIISHLLRTDAFPSKSFSNDCFTHDLQKLLEIAGLKTARDSDIMADKVLDGYWNIASLWSEQKRYETVEEAESRSLLQAIADPTHGVLRWVKNYW